MKFITKKNTLLFFIVLAFVAGVLLSIDISEVCTFKDVRNVGCSHLLSNVAFVLFGVVTLFLPFFLTLSAKIEIFKSWSSFAVWSIPAVSILTYVIVNFDFRSFIDIRPILYLVLLYSAYFFISLIIIFRAWRSGHGVR